MTRQALEVTVTAPVASFRNPLYAGVQAGLLCPPPATVGGMLAAARGGWAAVDPNLRFALAFRSGGKGVDLETYHPLDAGGAATSPTPRERHFLADVTLTIWLVEDLPAWQTALRRPVWPLRLGRSQDLVDVRARSVQLTAEPGRQEHAIVPAETSKVGTLLQLPTAISLDRTRTQWHPYRYAQAGSHSMVSADDSWADAAGRVVVLLCPTHPRPRSRYAMTVLASYWAKSARKPGEDGEALTGHLEAAFLAARAIAARIGHIDYLDGGLKPTFWRIAELAALAHDAGKIADGFQRMVKADTRAWGQRHEVLSLGVLPYLVTDPLMRDWVGLAVVTHHRPISTNDDEHDSLLLKYQGLDSSRFAHDLGHVDPLAAVELIGWITRTAGLELATADQTGSVDLVLSAHTELERLFQRWDATVTEQPGLSAVLLQGAVTHADHLSSAHGELDLDQPVNGALRSSLLSGWAATGRTIRPHQQAASNTDGHVIVRAPTGSGKSEAGLLWAARQLELIGTRNRCVPRFFYILPYLASINAMADRLSPTIGREKIGVAHSRAGSYYLAKAIEGADDSARRVSAAYKATARRAATQLFRETVRIGTPYQLLRGTLAGAVHSSVLLDSANSVFLLDELHAYDPQRLGFILAAAGFWERLGGRVGVLSATIPNALVDLLRDSLQHDIALIDGHSTNSPLRHRVLVRGHHLTDDRTVSAIADTLSQGRSVLVVTNNVKGAQDLFADLAPLAESPHGEEGAHLLHARFTRRDQGRFPVGTLSRWTGQRRGLMVGPRSTRASRCRRRADHISANFTGHSLTASSRLRLMATSLRSRTPSW